MTLIVYAHECMSCSSEVKPYLNLLRHWSYKDENNLKLKDTRYSIQNREDVKNLLDSLKLDQKYDINRYYPAFVYCPETSQTKLIKGLNSDKIAQITKS